MNIASIKKVKLSDLVYKVRISFQDIKDVTFEKTNGHYIELENAIRQACSLIYPYIYLPTSKEYTITNNFISLSNNIRSIALIAAYTNNGMEAIRDVMPIPPELDETTSWKVYFKSNYESVIVFAEETCFAKVEPADPHGSPVDIEYVYLTDEECLIKQAVYEVAKGRTLKRQTFDEAPASTQEYSATEMEMIQFTAITFDELTKLFNLKKMDRLSKLMMVPEHLGNKTIPVPEKSTPSNSYISTGR